MIMDEGMDTGDILLSSEVAITADMNFEELHNILAHNAAELLLKTLEHIKGVRSISELRSLAVPQDSSKATYAPVMRRKDAKIDWSKSSEEIHNLVRGTYDWPVAWCITDKGNMKVWKTKLTHEYYQEKMTPGSIIKSDDDGLHVACESGIIVIEELQFESQKRMKSVEYIRGHSSIEGWVLK
jgi:methionyl-tRNA formyltransferase